MSKMRVEKRDAYQLAVVRLATSEEREEVSEVSGSDGAAETHFLRTSGICNVGSGSC